MLFSLGERSKVLAPSLGSHHHLRPPSLDTAQEQQQCRYLCSPNHDPRLAARAILFTSPHSKSQSDPGQRTILTHRRAFQYDVTFCLRFIRRGCQGVTAIRSPIAQSCMLRPAYSAPKTANGASCSLPVFPV